MQQGKKWILCRIYTPEYLIKTTCWLHEEYIFVHQIMLMVQLYHCLKEVDKNNENSNKSMDLLLLGFYTIVTINESSNNSMDFTPDYHVL